MFLMYIDESGDTTSLEQGGSQVLVLTGCVINETDRRDIESCFREIKRIFYQNSDIEIKSNYLRYANPNIVDSKKSSPLKLYDQQQYNLLQIEIQNFLKTIPIILISVVIDKKGYWAMYPSQNPYHVAYIFLMERFQGFLHNKNALGLCIIDPREGRVVDKRNIDKELNDLHRDIQWERDRFWKPCPRIIEKVLFSDSSLTIGIQIADLYCYPIYNVFQYNKKQGEYAWFDTISSPKLYSQSAEPAVNDTGLKFFPDKTKPDFHFYQ